MQVSITWIIFLIFICFYEVDGVNLDKLVVFGGWETASVGVLDVTQFLPCDSQFPDVPQPYGLEGRVGAHSAVWQNSVIVCGGLDSSGPPISSFGDCHILDVLTGEWKEGPSMNNLTSYGSSAVTSQGKFYIIGGRYAHYDGPSPTQWVYLDTIQVLDLASPSEGWKTLDAKLDIQNTCTVTDGSDIYIIGDNRIVKFHGDSEDWEDIPSNLAVHAMGTGCALKGDVGDAHKFIVIAGGTYHSNKVGAIDMDTWAWIDLPSFQFERPAKPMIDANDERILIHGGSYDNVPMEVLYKGPEIGEWEIGGEMDQPRVDSTAVLMEDGLFTDCFIK